MAYTKGEVNRAGVVLAENPPLTNVDEFDRVSAAIKVADWWRSEHTKPLTQVAANLRYYAAEVGRPVVAQRLKRLPTIADKLVRHPTMKLAQMGDIGGVRAVVPDQASAYYLVKRLRRNWTITRINDYVVDPKPDGYRALHLINRHRGRLIEVQIRTPLQDKWANMVESFSGIIAPGLKFGGGPPRLRQLLIELSSTSARFEAGTASPEALSQTLQDMLAWADSL
jgi:putative GTP pyrophosphokinase